MERRENSTRYLVLFLVFFLVLLLLQWIEVRWKIRNVWVERQSGSLVRVVLRVVRVQGLGPEINNISSMSWFFMEGWI